MAVLKRTDGMNLTRTRRTSEARGLVAKSNRPAVKSGATAAGSTVRPWEQANAIKKRKASRAAGAGEGRGTTLGPTPSSREVAAFQRKLVAEAKEFVKKAGAATTAEEFERLTEGETLTPKLDKFVIDVEVNQTIKLPAGQKAVSVVTEAIIPLLEQGWSYGIEVGSRRFAFSLDPKAGYEKDSSGLYWSDATMR